jgi:hypothetical protein
MKTLIAIIAVAILCIAPTNTSFGDGYNQSETQYVTYFEPSCC